MIDDSEVRQDPMPIEGLGRETQIKSDTERFGGEGELFLLTKMGMEARVCSFGN